MTHDDIIVMVLSVDLTAGNSNPLDNVSFFTHWDSDKREPLRAENMTKLIYKDYEVRHNLVPAAKLHFIHLPARSSCSTDMSNDM